jgi:hypothetical protein
MNNQRTIGGVLAAILTLVSLALPTSSASAITEDKLITNFRFDTFNASAKFFDRQLVASAAQDMRKYLTAPSTSRRFVFKGYTDVRCNPAEFKKRYPRLKHLDVCAVRADKTTLGNWTLSLERALTLRDQVLARLSADEIASVKFEIEALAESKANASLTDCQRSPDTSPCSDDRRASIYLRRVYDPDRAVEALGDAPVFRYNDVFSFDVSANDSCLEASCVWSLVSPPSTGRVVMNPNGTATFVPPSADFSGTSSFQYHITAGTKGATALVTITVLPPPTIEPGVVSDAVKLTTPVWARLGVNEKFSLSVAPSCAVGVPVANRCEISDGSAGAYEAVQSATLTSLIATPPRGYRTSRFSVASPALGSVISPNTTIAGTFRFAQATQANDPFQVTAGLLIEYRKVWYHVDRNNRLIIDRTETNFRYSSITSKVGVIGNVSR